MSPSPCRRNGRLAVFACVVALVLTALTSDCGAEPSTADLQAPSSSTTSSRDLDEESLALGPNASTAASTVEEITNDYSAKDTSLVQADKGHEQKPPKTKKKKPMSKHKKKKQTFKDKLLPLLLIPFVIQTMLIPMFIMNLKMLAMKAMTIGKIAILLIVFNMMRSWSQNAHSTTVSGAGGLMAQNYGFTGGPEFGALFNG